MQRRCIFTRKENSMTPAKLAIPTLLAVFALLFAFKTVGIGTANGGSVPSADVAPTPYSADHARIPAERSNQEPAPTF
jgi:hypothetical protein